MNRPRHDFMKDYELGSPPELLGMLRRELLIGLPCQSAAAIIPWELAVHA